MPDIRYRCASCARKLCIEASGAGATIMCPHCRAAMAAPRPGPVGRLLSVDMRFRCPGCAQKIAVDVCHAGEVIGCPACGAVLTIPGLPADLGADAAKAAPEPASVLTQDEVAFLMAR